MDNIGGFLCVIWPSLNGKKGGKHRRVSLLKLAIFEWNESEQNRQISLCKLAVFELKEMWTTKTGFVVPLCVSARSRHIYVMFTVVRVRTEIILPVVLYGCETWSLVLRDERRLMVFENRVLRRVFGPKRDEVTGEWREIGRAHV